MPHMTNNQYFIRPLWCNGESLLGFFSWVGSTPLLRSLMIALLFVIPDHWLLPQSRDLKKPQAGMTRSASWVAYFYECPRCELVRVVVVTLAIVVAGARGVLGNERWCDHWAYSSEVVLRFSSSSLSRFVFSRYGSKTAIQADNESNKLIVHGQWSAQAMFVVGFYGYDECEVVKMERSGTE